MKVKLTFNEFGFPEAHQLPRLRPLRIALDVEGANFGRPSFLALPYVDYDCGPLLRTFYDQPCSAVKRVDEETSEYLLLPFDAKCLIHRGFAAMNDDAYRWTDTLMARAHALGKPVLALVAGDSTRQLDHRFTCVLRHSIDGRRRGKGEYCLPGWYDVAQNADPQHAIKTRPKPLQPTISFCGQALPSGWHSARRLRQLALRIKYGFRWGHDAVDPLLLRQQAMNVLASSSDISCNFIVRDRFYGGLHDREAAAHAYRKSILDSDYVLCVRGHGNYSFRLFDAMSMGRIPVLVDTDCVLPFDHLMDYRRFMPILPRNQMSRLPEVVREHFESYDEQQWRRLQEELRRFYVEWLSPRGFFSKLRLHPELAEQSARDETAA